MRRFFLIRSEDVNGNSGTGKVAEGVVFASGKAIIEWVGHPMKIAIYPSATDLEELHSHGGRTKLIWIDKVPFDRQVRSTD